MDADEINYLHKLVKAHTDRVRVLSLQAAQFGISCPPEIQTEIDKIEGEISSLKEQLGNNYNSRFNVKNENRKPVLTRQGSIIFRTPFLVLLAFVVGVATPLLIQTSSRYNVDEDIPLENLSAVSALLYENPQTGKGDGYLSVKNSFIDEKPQIYYNLYYNIPENIDSYAGFSLKFDNPIDVTGYNYIDMAVSFKDEQGRFRVVMHDILGSSNDVIIGDGKIIEARKEEQLVRIPIKTHFSSVSKKNITKIDFDVNNFFTQGSNSFTVTKITLHK